MPNLHAPAPDIRAWTGAALPIRRWRAILDHLGLTWGEFAVLDGDAAAARRAARRHTQARATLRAYAVQTERAAASARRERDAGNVNGARTAASAAAEKAAAALRNCPTGTDCPEPAALARIWRAAAEAAESYADAFRERHGYAPPAAW